MKKEYVEGIETEQGVTYLSLGEVAERNGCNDSYVRRRASKEGWTELRNIYLAKIEQKAREKKTDKLASKQSEFDFDVFKINKTLLNYIKLKINVLNAKITNKEIKEPTANEVDSLANILRKIQDIGKKALGDEDSSGNIDLEQSEERRTNIDRILASLEEMKNGQKNNNGGESS